jgi:WhiB family redox-sensing transcriptional regulator
MSDWQERAACIGSDPEAFFPRKGESAAIAKRICNTRCNVREDCLAYALEQRVDFGVWGGTTYRQRRKMRRDAELTEAA